MTAKFKFIKGENYTLRYEKSYVSAVLRGIIYHANTGKENILALMSTLVIGVVSFISITFNLELIFTHLNRRRLKLWRKANYANPVHSIRHISTRITNHKTQ